MIKLQALLLMRICSQNTLLVKPSPSVQFRKWRHVSTNDSKGIQASDDADADCDVQHSTNKVKTDGSSQDTHTFSTSFSSPKTEKLQTSEVEGLSGETQKKVATHSSVTQSQDSPNLSSAVEEVSSSNPAERERDLQDGSFPSALRVVTVVPGKGRPPEPPTTCCGTGCANCVWIIYAEELREYYKDGGEQARKALENIDDPSLKAFIKLELGL